jgi:succinate dehydrogenase/fumarate reductase cytochrome b subunit
MSTKVIAGVAMMVPAFMLHVYDNRQDITAYKQSFTETLYETAKTWGSGLCILTAIGTAYIGGFHVIMGLTELSPKICPRE